MQLINVAGEAGVPWIFPNEWSLDTINEALVKDIFVFQFKGKFIHFQFAWHLRAFIDHTFIFKSRLEKRSKISEKAHSSRSSRVSGTNIVS